MSDDMYIQVSNLLEVIEAWNAEHPDFKIAEEFATFAFGRGWRVEAALPQASSKN